MTTLRLRKSSDQSLRRHGFLLLSLTVVLAWLALAPAARAVLPEPDRVYGNGNTPDEDHAIQDLNADTENVEEGNAVLDLSTVAGNAALIGKQVKGKPNQWVIKIDFTKFVMCAMEKVRFRGELHIKFQPGNGGNVFPTDVRLKGQLPGKPFSALGTGKKPTLGRTYVLQDVTGKGFGIINVGNNNGFGHGSFGRKFEFIAKSNLPGKEVKFTLEWAPPPNNKADGDLSYEFKDGKVVIHLEARPPEIKCPRR